MGRPKYREADLSFTEKPCRVIRPLIARFMNKKMTEITVEIEQIAVLRRNTGTVHLWCNCCSAIVPMIRPEWAALLTQVTARMIYRQAEAGEVHFTETPEGALLICLDSLKNLKH